MSQTKPGYLKPLLVVTLVYLVVECAFNAELLDVASSSSASTDDIDHVEFYGRIISGFAAALAICGSVIFPWLHRNKYVPSSYAIMSLIVGIPIIALVYFGEKQLIDHLSEQSTAEERRIAMMVQRAAFLFKKGQLDIRGITVDTNGELTPESKSFVALFSPLVSSIPDIRDKIENQIDDILGKMAVKMYGTADDYYHGAFKQTHDSLKALYDMLLAEKDLDKEADKKWKEYLKLLSDNRIKPRTIGSYEPIFKDRRDRKVREVVRSRGVPVSDSWDIFDENGFKQTVKMKAMSSFENKRKKLVALWNLPDGFTLKGISSFREFLSSPYILPQWKSKLRLPKEADPLHSTNLPDFEKNVYVPLVQDFIAFEKKKVLSEIKNYSNTGKYAKEGIEAYRAAIVPVFALLFSLLGAIVHICKTMYFSMRLALSNGTHALIFNSILFVALMCVPFFITTTITSSSTYARIEEKITTQHNVMAPALRWIIQCQSVIYPVNNFFRNKVLMGYSFGVKNSTE